MPKAVLFDMDGVLIDSYEAWYCIFNKTLSHFQGRTISREEFNKKVWAQDFHTTSKEYFKVELKEILAYFITLKEILSKKAKVFPGIKRLLAKLKKRGIMLAVVTNTNKIIAESILKKLDLFAYFDIIIGGDEVKNGKPEPDMLLLALNKLNLKNSQVIFIGDSEWDKLAAQNAKIRFHFNTKEVLNALCN